MSALMRSYKVLIPIFFCAHAPYGSTPEKLKSSAYGNEEDIKTMLEYFQTSTKPIFKDDKETSYIRFGSMSCNDRAVGIRRGQLAVEG